MINIYIAIISIILALAVWLGCIWHDLIITKNKR